MGLVARHKKRNAAVASQVVIDCQRLKGPLTSLDVLLSIPVLGAELR
jgi:hypothetical protein